LQVNKQSSDVRLVNFLALVFKFDKGLFLVLDELDNSDGRVILALGHELIFDFFLCDPDAIINLNLLTLRWKIFAHLLNRVFVCSLLTHKAA
jgi:hypothetical protein